MTQPQCELEGVGDVIFPVEKKPWGESIPIYRDDKIEVIRAKILRGGYSSLHRHNRKRNVFIVHSGSLIVEMGRLTSATDLHHVGVGMPLEVPEGIWHRFRARSTDADVLEVYISADGSPPDPADIERIDSNGICL